MMLQVVVLKRGREMEATVGSNGFGWEISPRSRCRCRIRKVTCQLFVRRFRPLSTERHVAAAASNGWRWWRGAVQAAEISCQYSTELTAFTVVGQRTVTEMSSNHTVP
jgi:hypothetical protein